MLKNPVYWILLLSIGIPSGAQAIFSPFAVIGDTQQTLLLEQLFLKRESNDRESKILIQALSKEDPSLVVFLGDFVAWGSSKDDWLHFDRLIAPLTKKKIPKLGVIGNHEYFGWQEGPLPEVNARFPGLATSSGYVSMHGSLALVGLNSNAEALGKREWKNQQKWLKSTLKKLDEVPLVQGVLVFAHHPLYTNSDVTGDEPEVEAAFLPALQASKKTMAYISGHAHGYEHFFEHGLDFIVSGGGGGPRVDYLKGKKARHFDLYSGPTPRPFHFLWIQEDPKGVRITVRGFLKGESVLRNFDEFVVKRRVF